jgi:phage baseplate assembly protein V
MAGEDNLLNLLERWIAPWKRRILSMVLKGLVNSSTDSGNLQVIEATTLKGEIVPDAERVQEFGFTSRPPKNSEAIVLSLGGNQNHPVIIATDNSAYRLKGLPDGACAIYNKNGDYVKLTANKIEVYANEITLGKSTFKKLINEKFQSLFNNHGHDYTPSGTGEPAVTGRPVNGIVATSTPTPITSDEMTAKTKAE